LIGLQIAVILLLIVVNGLLAMSELAIVSSRTSRLQQRVDANRRGAQTALELAENPNRFLSTVQVGITLIGVVNGVFGGAALAEPLGNGLARIPGIGRYSDGISVFAVVAVITYLSLIIGELVPKRLAIQQPENVACLVAAPMKMLSRIAAPAVTLLGVSSDLVLRLMGTKAPNEPAVTEEEIHLLLKQGADAGVFHHSERSMVEGVFGIGDRSANEVMTPRHRMDYLDLSDPDEVTRRRMGESPHSFFPVVDGSADTVVGVVATRELWRRQVSGESTDIRDAMQPALFVPEIAPMLSIIEQMRRRHSPIAIVIDEYGGVEGLLTFNDVLSDLVGEIDDPNQSNVKGGVRRDDGSWLLDGVFPAHELRELFAIDSLPGENEGRFETIAGFLMDQLGHIPDLAEELTWNGFRFEVMDKDGIRIDKILVVPPDSADAREASEDANAPVR